MNLPQYVSSVLVLALLNLSITAKLAPFANADVTSSLTGEKLFIKISRTTEGPTSDDTRIKFEKCQIETPATCDLIGSRDYSIRELREHRELLIQEAEKAGVFGFSGVIGTILGVVGGMGVGGISGGLTGAAFGGPGDAALAAAAGGLFIGVIVGAAAGGFIIYKVIRHHKKKKAKKLNAEAFTLEEQMIEGQPVSIQMDVEVFAKSLADTLASLPAATVPTRP